MQWEPVQYFNNKIICDLVEEKFKGIISILVRRRSIAVFTAVELIREKNRFVFNKLVTKREVVLD